MKNPLQENDEISNKRPWWQQVHLVWKEMLLRAITIFFVTERSIHSTNNHFYHPRDINQSVLESYRDRKEEYKGIQFVCGTRPRSVSVYYSIL